MSVVNLKPLFRIENDVVSEMHCPNGSRFSYRPVIRRFSVHTFLFPFSTRKLFRKPGTKAFTFRMSEIHNLAKTQKKYTQKKL